MYGMIITTTSNTRRESTMAATKARPIVMTEDLWKDFARAVAEVDPETNRSAVVRSFVRWYVGEPGAKLPERPQRAA